MNNKKLRRSESFIGFHFDFHAVEEYKLAIDDTAEVLQELLEQAQPDFVQCDSKGHPGVASYPTKFGTKTATPEVDPLKVWREVTEKNNTALYVHYSGMWDGAYLKENPNYGIITADGTREHRLLNFYSPYLDEKMIPQIQEFAGKYGVDGIWVDGDCWGVGLDYGKEAIEEFTKKTGITEIPKKPEDPYFYEFSEFSRDKYKEYLKKYVDTIHHEYPNFQICTNWMYTAYSPEVVDIDVDFLSGDYPPSGSANEARFHGRCTMLQKKPWDLMAWGFAGDCFYGGFSLKTLPMLQQELSVILALGGGVQIYYTQNIDSTLKKSMISTFTEATKYCRERQPWCQHTKSAADMAIFYSRYAQFHQQKQPYTPAREEVENLNGALTCVLETGMATDIISEHNMAENSSRYQVIIVPEWKMLENKTIEFLMEYVKKGGNIFVEGSKTCELFASYTGIETEEEKEENIYIPHNEKIAFVRGAFRKIKSYGKDTQIVTNFSDREEKGMQFPCTAITKYGDGKILTMHANVLKHYNQIKNCYVRDYINSLIRMLNKEPLAYIEGTHFVDLSLQKKENKVFVHLVNMSGFACLSNPIVFDEIPQIHDFTVRIRVKQAPNQILLQPTGKQLQFEYADGYACVKIDKLDIHGIIEIM